MNADVKYYIFKRFCQLLKTSKLTNSHWMSGKIIVSHFVIRYAATIPNTKK